jgi:multidrug efflux pump subunit AcrA (membrane-fusion protein)
MLLLPLATALTLGGCGGGESHTKATVPGAAVPVQAAAVSSQQWPDLYEATGTVRARATAVLSSRVMAYVQQVAVQVGEHVREGQPLITLDSQELDANVRRAEAAGAEVRSAIPEAMAWLLPRPTWIWRRARSGAWKSS